MELKLKYNHSKGNQTMKSDIFISVIIPVYNTSEIILRQCIDSIINQSITEIEIILIDDGSTNNALDVLKEYEQIDPRIKVLTQKNQYAGNARNNGMDIAKGDYLCFFDSDDYCKKNYLEKLYFTAQSYGSDVVICEEDFHDIDLDIVVPRLCKTDETFWDGVKTFHESYIIQK